MATIGKDLKMAAKLLSANELIAIPTETVYGLAANAFSPEAVAKVFQTKNRPTFNPLILHTCNLEKAGEFVQEIPEKAKKLANKFWPGPLTMLFYKKDLVPDLVTAGLPRVAVRVPRHSITQQLLQLLPFPLAAPSANPFGYVSPTRPGHVNDQLGDKIKYILDGGPCQVGIESTIVGFEEDQVLIYRLGGLSLEDIEKVVGSVEKLPHSSSQPQSPGMLKSHYAPGKKVLMGDIDQLLAQIGSRKVGVVSLQKEFPNLPADNQVILSRTGNLQEAAAGLFEALRYLDNLPITYIFAEPMPDYGLGRAINDRLKRAAAE
ncbi:MAG: L-threonylcarbamoyladenylate synthase [Cyclobacteriaceae bacterium]